MTKLESLENIAHANDIHVIDAHFSDTKKAACVHNDYKLIILDKPQLSSTSEQGVLFAEELGHYETNSLYFIESTYNTPLARGNRAKYEAYAKNWAIENYLDADEIQQAINSGCANDYEVAEFCNVPIDFLYEAIKHYERKGVYLQSRYTEF